VRSRPAWSAQFAPETLPELERLDPIEHVTAEWAWGGSAGEGVRVAVIDSGIDEDHPNVGPVSGYVNVVQREGDGKIVLETGRHDDWYGHGTACAGIIRAIAPKCDIYSVRVLGPMLTGSGEVFAAGLRWALQNDIDVCNLSLGTTKQKFYALLHELADGAYFRNTMLVTAANNIAVPSFPSVYASVISVASHDRRDHGGFFYNPRPPVEFGALGIDVRVPWLNRGWITATGNSFAAPRITGTVARILSKHPALTVFQMKAILRALAANTSGPVGVPSAEIPRAGERG
jgi:subtilisin